MYIAYHLVLIYLVFLLRKIYCLYIIYFGVVLFTHGRICRCMGYCYEPAFGLIGMSFEGEIYSRLEIGVMQIDAK